VYVLGKYWIDEVSYIHQINLNPQEGLWWRIITENRIRLNFVN
jgi:hypothetical protein